MDRQQCLDAMNAAHARMEQLAGKHRLTAAEQEEFSRLGDQFDDMRKQVERLELQAKVRTGDYHAEGEGLNLPGYGGPDRREPSARDAALRTLDRHVRSGSIAAAGAETVESLLGTGGSWVARWAVATGDDDYTRAFAKLFSGGPHGHLRWTAAEAEAYRRVEMLRDEQRALGIGGSGNGGDSMVPLSLDPAILLSSAGSTSSILDYCRVETIATDSWHGVSSAGVTAEWRDELEESSDGTPTLTGPSVAVHRGSAFVPYSFEVEQDALGFIAELQRLLLDAALQLNNVAYTVGSGTGEPKGFVTALAAVAGSVVAPTTAETLAAADVFKVQISLPPRFQANAAWAAALPVLNTLRQFETAGGALKFPGLQEIPPSLLGRPVFEQSPMDSTYDAAATADNYLLAYADFTQFLVVNRIGATFERVDHLVGSNRRPNGTRGGLLWWRTGSDFLVPNAGRLLNVETTE